MKKLILFAAAIFATLSFVSCGSSKEEVKDTDSVAVDTVEVVDTVTVDTVTVDTVTVDTL